MSGLAGAVLLLLLVLLAAFAWWRFYFFHRNPPRVPPPGQSPVCPADGLIVYDEVVALAPDAGDAYHRRVSAAFGAQGRWQVIATYLGIFDVHVVRAPVAGTLRLHRMAALGAQNASMGGAFVFAALRRPLPVGHRGYLEKNEFLGVEIQGLNGRPRVLLVLMADWWIDQIVALVQDGAQVERGQVIGRIKMGSQVDLWAPEGCLLPLLRCGERASAGDRLLARWCEAGLPV